MVTNGSFKNSSLKASLGNPKWLFWGIAATLIPFWNVYFKSFFVVFIIRLWLLQPADLKLHHSFCFIGLRMTRTCTLLASQRRSVLLLDVWSKPNQDGKRSRITSLNLFTPKSWSWGEFEEKSTTTPLDLSTKPSQWDAPAFVHMYTNRFKMS